MADHKDRWSAPRHRQECLFYSTRNRLSHREAIYSITAMKRLFLLALLPATACLAADLALTPPMGWNSWNKFADKIDDKTVRAVADAMVSSGMKDAGYVYINIDDTWEA